MKNKLFLIIILTTFVFIANKIIEPNYPEPLFSYDVEVSGEIDENRNIIIYNRYLAIWQKDLTYLHERCHLVWRKNLNDTEMKEYGKIYENATYFVSDYAKTDVREDFAESCKYYITYGKLDNERMGFFIKIHNKLELINMRS